MGVNIQGFGWLPDRRESIVPAAFSLLEEYHGKDFMEKEFQDYYPYEEKYEETKFPNKNMIPLAKKLGHHILELMKKKKGDTEWMQTLEASRDPKGFFSNRVTGAYNYWIKGGEKTITWIEKLFADQNTEPGLLNQGCNIFT